MSELTTSRSNRWRRAVAAVLAEPLVSFLALGSLLYAVYFICKPPAITSILVDQASIATLMAREEQTRGRAPTTDERHRAIENHIQDEILVREARRMGLDRQDRDLRMRMVASMRSLLDEPVAQPNSAELRAYFESHRGTYSIDRAVTFDQVFVPQGTQGSDSGQLLSELRNGADFRQMGDQSWSGPTMRRMTARELSTLFGGDLVTAVFELPLRRWEGPIASRHGLHFVRIQKQYPPREPDFSEVVETVHLDWEAEQHRRIISRKIDKIRAEYQVHIDDAEAADAHD